MIEKITKARAFRFALQCNLKIHKKAILSVKKHKIQRNTAMTYTKCSNHKRGSDSINS